jgi:dCTP deaminase
MRCYTSQEWQNQTPDKPKLYIEPFSPDSLTPIGYDLRVGSRYASASKGEDIYVNRDSPLIIEPNDTVLITTLEEIRMPKNHKFSGLILSKVSKVSKGLSHVATTVDSDWSGKLLVTIHNYSSESVTLSFKEPCCTVVFFENKSASTKESGHAPGRQDILIEKFSSDARKAQLEKERQIRIKRDLKKRKKRTKNLLQILSSTGIIASSVIIGYLFFKKNPQSFITTIGVGVAISQTALVVITNLFEDDDE